MKTSIPILLLIDDAPFVAKVPERRCASCNRKLNRYNTAELCHACMKTANEEMVVRDAEQ